MRGTGNSLAPRFFYRLPISHILHIGGNGSQADTELFFDVQTTPKFSIIIPHKDNPKLLQRCLDSIPQREDTEIVIVDDNSDPAKVDFKTFPGLDRDGVKVIFDKVGRFAGHARNVAIEQATGEWILCADCDDFLTQCFNDELDGCYSLSDDVDICFFNACSLDCVNYTNTNRASHLNKFIRAYQVGDPTAELKLRYYFGEPWCKLVRKRLIDEHHIRFEERSIHEDTSYSYLVGFHARKIAVSEKAIYCVTDRASSLSKVYDKSKRLEKIDVFATKEIFHRKHNIPLEETWHLEELFELYLSDKGTYRKGVELCLSKGIARSEIRSFFIKEFSRRLLPKLRYELSKRLPW